MKRKILALLIALVFLFIFTGCKDKVSSSENIKNSIVLEDTKHGFNTTFFYKDGEIYNIKEEKGGAYKEILVSNEKNNVEFDIYYFEMTDSSYDSSKNTRKNSNGFKEYKWGKYEGYIYNVDNNSLSFNILLRKSTKNKALVGIFGSVSSINNKGIDVLKGFNSKEIQDLLNTITFVE